MVNTAFGKFLFLSLFLLITITSHAQIKAKIERYSTEDGLSHDGVMTMIKDQEGFMWFGTWDGINRFDGHNFVTYKAYPGDNSKLKNNRIGEIVEDQAGFLWLTAYDNQVYRFDKKTEQFFAIADLLQEKGITNIAFNKIVLAQPGVVWLTTTNQGVFCVKKANSARPEIIPYPINQAVGKTNAGNQIHFLYPAQNNTVWVGSSQGLHQFSPKADGPYSNGSLQTDSLSQLNFTCVIEGKNKIWFGTSNGYLVSYEKKTNTFVKSKICSSKINGLLLSRKRENVLYLVNSQSQLLTVNTSDLSTTTASVEGKGAFLSVFEDTSGLLWIQPEFRGAIKYNPGSKQFRFFFQPIDATFHISVKNYKVFEDHKKRVWVSMQGGGFGYYDPTTDAIKYFYNEPGSLEHRFSNYVSSLYLDNTGVLWLCTNDRGINKVIFQENYFDYKILVPNTANNSDNEVRGVYNDSKNRIWLAAKSGKLYVYDQHHLVQNLFVNLPKEGLGIVYTIFEDSKNNIWLGTKGNGLFKAQPTGNASGMYQLMHFLPDKNDSYSLSGDMVYAFLEDRKGCIWVGTYGHGINLVEQTLNKLRFINANNQLSHHKISTHTKIRHLQEGPNGDIWIATTDGLVVLNPNLKVSDKFSLYKKVSGNASSLGNNDVQYIFKDSKNVMWVCTSGGGLNQAIIGKEGVIFKVFTKEQGLPNDYILSVAEDNQGNLWLATENGISKFNPKTQQFKNFDSYEGLEQTGFSEAAAIKLQNGNLLFGARSGYLTFNPAETTKRKVAANMVFTNFQINNKDVTLTSPKSPLKQSINYTPNIELAYNENILGIEFTVLDYHASDKLNYAYRLTNFDEEWHQVKNQRKATYTNLPPGEYVFEVKSQDPELFQSLPYKKIAVTIHPPIWRTTWAYVVYIILALILLEIVRRVAFSMIRLRNRIAIEQKLTELKLRFFTNISHELRTPLTLIVNPIEAISQQADLTPKSREYIQVVRKNTNRMVRFINQLLDFRKAQSGKMKLKIAQTEIISILKDISSHFTEAAAEKQITLSVTSNVDELSAWIDLEKMDIVIYNLLSNAIKFSSAGKSVTVDVHYDKLADFFTIKVIDQGVGIPANKLNDVFELYYEGDKKGVNNWGGTGIGLALAKELVELHHGKITAQNNATEGVTIMVELKTGKEHFTADEVVWLDTPLALSRKYEPADEALPAFENADTNVTALESLPLVLIVEDNPDLRKLLTDQFRLYYKVIQAENGEEGLAKAMQQLPDLVISDVMMPKMDGIQLLDKLKNTVETSHIPVILLTAKTSVEHQIEGLNYGADYYITKPFQSDFILAAVKNLLHQRKKIFESLLGDKRTIDLSPSEIVITSKDEVFLKKIISIVENGMSDPEFNIDAVAETVGMGRTTFYKKFTSLTNLAPVEFVREMRLKRGKQLLDAGENNISEVAYAIGFNNAGYFSTCFKKQYQVTPSEYVKSLKAPLV
ncbi:hybrid sensor histidine kinase/response regulator transcription factor [Adhaeribacter radiodurans]|uniref:histidine kinase n=1 Tax=Adhaeribacter radiodurans TaxID=2745197 RepID=A0A7L7L2R0_9BACT|nr:two-component regulator propeller domain-containing protein [Adhaeribacter radiodurans]QMU27081.1 response regulator [Adhaeribacter radiodurans]